MPISNNISTSVNCDPSGSGKPVASYWPGLRYYLLPKVMKLKFEHALVALDLSDSAEALVRSLSYFRQFDTERFTLLTSLPVSYAGVFNRKKRQQAQNKLDHYRDLLKEEGFSANTVLKFAILKSHAAVITDTAKERGLRWIVMGNRGQNSAREYFLGSTATEVLHLAKIPVMLLNVSPGKSNDTSAALEKGSQRALHHIIHPTDYSEASTHAFNVMKQLIAHKTKSVTLVHVDSNELPAYVDKESVLSSMQRIKRLKELSNKLTYPEHLKVYIEMPRGAPAKEISRVINKSNYTLLVMATRGKGHLNDLFGHSLSYKIARLCKLPILFVPGE